MTSNAIFIGATGQNVGKSTICLGIISGLIKRHSNVGFIKPVGQRHVQVPGGRCVDKDVVLFKEHFHLPDDYKDMSPVIIPSGFTREYLDGTVSTESLHDQIISSYQHIADKHTFTIVEGTGHIGVGSIVGLNNAVVAASLGLDMVIIVSGGLGSAFDELSINIAMCQQYGVKIKGVILNRVLDDKRSMILEYFPKALQPLGIPLIGAVPFDPFLSTPAMKDFEALLKTSLITGRQHQLRHFQDTRLVAGSLKSYYEETLPNQLIITPASREDIILAALDQHERSKKETGIDLRGGMILTGRSPPSCALLDKIREHDFPILYAEKTSYEVMQKITSFTAKTTKEDLPKVEEAIEVVEQYIDFDKLTS